MKIRFKYIVIAASIVDENKKKHYLHMPHAFINPEVLCKSWQKNIK